MYTFDYYFYPKQCDSVFLDEYTSTMDAFLAALISNGQVINGHDHMIFSDNTYIYRFYAPEKDSLNEKYYNTYCREWLSTVTELSIKKPEFRLVVKDYDTTKICECRESSFYVLKADLYLIEPPVICSCQGHVPLYRLPKIRNDEYFDVLQWQKVYKACDQLFMDGTGERYGYKMMHNPQSTLAINGRKVCSFWEDATGKAFYYFLFKFYGKNKNNCPVCGKNWVNHDASSGYAYVCHSCRVVSKDLS